MPPTRLCVEDEELGWLCQVDISEVQRDHMESVVVVVILGAIVGFMVLVIIFGLVYEYSSRFRNLCHPRSWAIWQHPVWRTLLHPRSWSILQAHFWHTLSNRVEGWFRGRNGYAALEHQPNVELEEVHGEISDEENVQIQESEPCKSSEPLSAQFEVMDRHARAAQRAGRDSRGRALSTGIDSFGGDTTRGRKTPHIGDGGS